MQRMTLAEQELQPNFIGSWMIEPVALCDEIITYFESNQGKQLRGRIGGGVNLQAKNSVDLTMSPKDLMLPDNKIFEAYFHALFDCYQDYRIQWPFLKTFAEELHIGSFNIQRYEVGQHFQQTHTERSSLATLHRLFAWMTYLNDVEEEDDGTTLFTHYNLKVQPKKGLTLIWPAEWTHAHKGSVLHAHSKYIITGWMHFPSEA